MRNKLNHKRVAPSATYAAQRWIILFHVRTKWQYKDLFSMYVLVGVCYCAYTHQDTKYFSFRKKIVSPHSYKYIQIFWHTQGMLWSFLWNLVECWCRYTFYYQHNKPKLDVVCINDGDDDGWCIGGGNVWFTKDVVYHPRFDSVFIISRNKQVGQKKKWSSIRKRPEKKIHSVFEIIEGIFSLTLAVNIFFINNWVKLFCSFCYFVERK